MMLLLNLTLKNKSSKNKDTPPIHPPHPLNTLPTKRSKAERVGSVIVKTRILFSKFNVFLCLSHPSFDYLYHWRGVLFLLVKDDGFYECFCESPGRCPLYNRKGYPSSMNPHSLFGEAG